MSARYVVSVSGTYPAAFGAGASLYGVGIVMDDAAERVWGLVFEMYGRAL